MNTEIHLTGAFLSHVTHDHHEGNKTLRDHVTHHWQMLSSLNISLVQWSETENHYGQTIGCVLSLSKFGSCSYSRNCAAFHYNCTGIFLHARVRLKSLFVMLNPCVTGLALSHKYSWPRIGWLHCPGPMIGQCWPLGGDSCVPYPVSVSGPHSSVAKTGCKVDGLNCRLEGVRKYQDL